MRLLRTIGGIDFTGQERTALNKLTMPPASITSVVDAHPRVTGSPPRA